LTVLLGKLRDGHREAASALFPLVNDELRRMAASYMRRERPDHTLQATALVNEAFLKVAGTAECSFENRAHFFGVAARAMRQILVDYARTHQSFKRGAGAKKIELKEAMVFSEPQSDEILAVDEALGRLEALSPRQARIVELRFFAGLPVPETATVLGVSERQVVRDWSVAQAWLRRELGA